MTIKEQIKLVTGKQEVICDCGKSMNVTVSKVKRNNQRRSYRGTCRHCKMMVSSIKFCN